PYPASSTDPISKGLPWPNAGVANLDRIKQAVWDAFHGTGQPTFESGLGLVISEIGWQVGVAGPSASAYFGHEYVPVTDEATYAAAYVRVSPKRSPSRGAIDRALTSGELDAAEGDVSAGGLMPVTRPPRPARPGTYVLAVSLRAAMTSDRRSLFLSRPVRIR